MSTKKLVKTAAIYDRWLHTLGGGEQVVCMLAQTLTELGWKTDIISHTPIDKIFAQKKLGIDLSNCNLRTIPLASSAEISQYSEQYTLFINSSYLDYFPVRSPLSILNTFFPGEIILSPSEYLKRVFFLPTLKKMFIYPTQFVGFTHDQLVGKTILKWLGTISHISFFKSCKKLSFTLYFPIHSFALSEEMIFLYDDSVIKPTKIEYNNSTNCCTYFFDLPHTTTGFRMSMIKPTDFLDYEVALKDIYLPEMGYLFYNVFKHFFPNWEMRLHGGPDSTTRADLQSYDMVLTISNFCQYWIKKYWMLPSTVLYPPVNTDLFKPAEKNDWICHVGRFFVTGHNKKQLEIIRQFKRVIKQPKAKGWELHLIGSVAEGEKHQTYLQACKTEAQGLPIFFHINVSHQELRELLAKSKIYWHATGLDQDPNKNPILMEHFGITTVEAMAAGCVPIVIAQGGQSEIVAPDTGFSWKTRDEWFQQTTSLIKNPKELKKMSENAQLRSSFFSKQEFKKNFNTILSTLIERKKVTLK